MRLIGVGIHKLVGPNEPYKVKKILELFLINFETFIKWTKFYYKKALKFIPHLLIMGKLYKNHLKYGGSTDNFSYIFISSMYSLIHLENKTNRLWSSNYL